MSEVMEKFSIHLFTLATLPSFWQSLMQQKRLVCVLLSIQNRLFRVKTEYWLENDRNPIFNTDDNINTTKP